LRIAVQYVLAVSTESLHRPQFGDWGAVVTTAIALQDTEHCLGVHLNMPIDIMVYWLPNAAAASARLYWESFKKFNYEPVQIQVGCSIFPKDILRVSRRWAEKRYPNLVHWNLWLPKTPSDFKINRMR
jgi:hypothetical protein